MSSKLRQLIFLSILFTSCLAATRFFPNRYKEANMEDYLRSNSFLRHLEEEALNSQNANRTLSEASVVSVRLRGDTDLGYYYVTLFFGSPLQRQTLIVDTGSSVSAIPCSDCDCGSNHWNVPFNQKNSKSFQEFECQEEFGNYACYDCNGKCYFHIGYAEGSSYYGNYKKDYVVFGNEAEKYYEMMKNQPSAKEDESVESRRVEQEELEQILEKRKMIMPFGCISKETKLFYSQEADGILGLGLGTNSRSNPPNVLDVFQMSNSNNDKSFSLCYAQRGGYFTVGGLNGAYHEPSEKIQYVPYQGSSQYRVNLKNIEMEGVSLGLTSQELNYGSGAFFDSGTTYTHVPRATLNAFSSNLYSFCGKSSKNCASSAPANKDKFCWKYDSTKYETLADFYATFPTFTFSFGPDGNAKYEWKAEDYFFQYSPDKPYYCVGITRYDSETILGGTFMKNHDVLFDKNNKRLGFVRSNCSSLNDDVLPVYKIVYPTSANPDPTTEQPKNETVQQPNNQTNQEPNKEVPQTPVDPTPIDSKNEDRINKAIIVLAIGLILAAALFIYIKLRNKGKYNDMANEGEGQNEFKNVSEDSNNIQTLPNGDAESRTNSEFEI